MEALAPLLDLARQNPFVTFGGLAGAVVVYVLLTRKPRMQRDADARLSALRREKSDQYTKQRPMR
jgi:hypothetical protein